VVTKRIPEPLFPPLISLRPIPINHAALGNIRRHGKRLTAAGVLRLRRGFAISGSQAAGGAYSCSNAASCCTSRPRPCPRACRRRCRRGRRHRARCARQCRRWGRVGSLAVAVCSCGSTALCNLWNFCHRGAFCHWAGGFGPAEADSAFGGSHVCLYAACPRGRRPVTERGQAGQELQELSWALFRRTLHVGGISSPLSVGHSLGRLVPLRNRPGRRTSRPPRPSHVGGKSEAPSCHRGRQQN